MFRALLSRAANRGMIDEYVQDACNLLNKQLAAEREKFQKAKEWNQVAELELRNARSLYTETFEDLGRIAKENQQLREQLAAALDLIEHADPANLSSRLRDKLTDVISDALAKAKLSDDSFVPEADQRELSKLTGELVARITEYFAVGGMFNPELMEHEKVRDLLMDCRAGLDAHNAAIAAERARYRLDKQPLVECLNYYAQDTGQGSTHEKARQLLIDMGLWPTKLAKMKEGK